MAKLDKNTSSERTFVLDLGLPLENLQSISKIIFLRKNWALANMLMPHCNSVVAKEEDLIAYNEIVAESKVIEAMGIVTQSIATSIVNSYIAYIVENLSLRGFVISISLKNVQFSDFTPDVPNQYNFTLEFRSLKQFAIQESARLISIMFSTFNPCIYQALVFKYMTSISPYLSVESDIVPGSSENRYKLFFNVNISTEQVLIFQLENRNVSYTNLPRGVKFTDLTQGEFKPWYLHAHGQRTLQMLMDSLKYDAKFFKS